MKQGARVQVNLPKIVLHLSKFSHHFYRIWFPCCLHDLRVLNANSATFTREGGTSSLMNTFHVFSSAIVERPVVTLCSWHCFMRDWIASADDTDCANLAFERVYSWPGYNCYSLTRWGKYVDFCIWWKTSKDFVKCCIHFFGGSLLSTFVRILMG